MEPRRFRGDVALLVAVYPLFAALRGRLPAAAAGLAFVLLVMPGWGTVLREQARVHGDASSLAATAWILRNVPRQDVVVVDDYMWTDLRLAGRHPLWLWTVDTDSQVSREVLPRGYQSIQYIVLAPQAPAR
jgi:hypothetical protein